MGGYGGASRKIKDKCYYDTGGHKVTDNNAIEIAEAYINRGKYVAFLMKRDPRIQADLSVEGIHTEVKGLSTLDSTKIAKRISHANDQVHADNYRYPPETHREGKIVILSKHQSNVPEQAIINSIKVGLQKAKSKSPITAAVEIWIKGKIIKIN